jgi:hypothetical protein
MRKIWSPAMEKALDALSYEESFIQYAKTFPSIEEGMLVEIYHNPWTCAGFGRVTRTWWSDFHMDYLCRVELFWSNAYYPDIPAHKLKKVTFEKHELRETLLKLVRNKYV